jgi:uncharacterized membrane protein YqhA
MDIGKYTNEQLGWMIGIHLVFAVSGLLFAAMDRLSVHKHDRR